MLRLLVLLLVNIVFTSATTQSSSLYWRDYDGTIPEDAIVAAEDSNGKTYIGQVLLNDGDVGLYPTWIREGDKEVKAYGAHFAVVKKYIKILCGNRKKLSWRDSSEGFFGKLFVPVVGGAELKPRDTAIYIGRHGSYVGTVYGSDFTKLYYADETEAKSSTSFSLLVIDQELFGGIKLPKFPFSLHISKSDK